MSFSVYVRGRGEDDISDMLKLGNPAVESVDAVLQEMYSDEPPDYVDEEGGAWWELDADTCRARAAEAARSAVPDPRWPEDEWQAGVTDGFEELAEVLEAVQRRTGKKPLVCAS